MKSKDRNDKMRARAEFESYPVDEYPEVRSIDFPEVIHVAYAVCGRTCGNKGFIVDGQTQVCEYCGKNMFRTEVREYLLKGT